MESNVNESRLFKQRNLLGLIHDDFSALQIVFRENVCVALHWEYITFYKIMVKGVELSLEEQDIIGSIIERTLADFGIKLKSRLEQC